MGDQQIAMTAAADTTSLRDRRGMLASGFLSMIMLGVLNAQLGVAWPSIRRTFGVPVDALGMALAAGTVGFFIASVISGWLVKRLGGGGFLVLGSAIYGLGPLAYVVSPVWAGAVGAALLMGLGGGLIEVALNTYVATRHTAREMNWLHASYGIGATLGPMIASAAISSPLGWRGGYGVVAIFALLMVAYYALTTRRWRDAFVLNGESTEEQAGAPAPRRPTLSLATVWVGIVLFFLYTGTEVAVGQWTFSLFTEARAIPTGVASFWVSVYWATFTAGRILLGFVVERTSAVMVLRVSMIGAIVGAGLLWWNPANAAAFGGLALLGFSFASIYPGMTSLTPARVGEAHAPATIGYQTGSAGLGAAALPGLAGVLADNVGFETFGPFILGASVLLLVLYEASLPRGRRSA